jgi:AraC family transcriptional regulator
MVLREFPNLTWLKAEAEKRFAGGKSATGEKLAHRGWPTVVLNATTNSTYRDNIRGPLSIFTNVSGESWVKVENRNIRVQDSTFFVSNPDQYYTLEVREPKTETFNIHFGEYLLEEAFQSLSCAESSLPDLDLSRPSSRPEFRNRLYGKTDAFNRLLCGIRLIGNDSFLLDEKICECLSFLVHTSLADQKLLGHIGSVRSSTRAELLRRLFISADYIHTYFEKDLSLDEIAAVACLSKFHFLRLFKITFRKTPHQFLSELRIQRAKSLLKNTMTPISRISTLTGHKDASSFSRQFKKYIGIYPVEFRNFAN